MAATKNWSRLKTLLSDRQWRLANLYRIRDKAAKVVPFRPNWAQRRLFDGLAHRNVDLKVRQLGVTTGYCMLWLDTCLFSGNVAVGIASGGVPAAAGGAAGASADAGVVDAALDAGIGQSDILGNHIDNAQQCGAIRAQLDALIDWHAAADR
ncbi:MAG: hypothetical protein ISP90_16055 [Nevskia sp.]|nr:hypothetical protein [Nevskia sp.]